MKKEFNEKISNKYIGRIEDVVSSRKPYLLMYRELLQIRKDYINDEVCKTKLSGNIRMEIFSFINWNLNIYKDLAHLKFNSFKMFTDNIKGKQR